MKSSKISQFFGSGSKSPEPSRGSMVDDHDAAVKPSRASTGSSFVKSARVVVDDDDLDDGHGTPRSIDHPVAKRPPPRRPADASTSAKKQKAPRRSITTSISIATAPPSLGDGDHCRQKSAAPCATPASTNIKAAAMSPAAEHREAAFYETDARGLWPRLPINAKDRAFTDPEDPAFVAALQHSAAATTAACFTGAAKTTNRKAKYTPLQQQWLAAKFGRSGAAAYPLVDILVAAEVGYKYLFLGGDADVAAGALNIYCVQPADEPFSRASVPTARLAAQASRLVSRGYCVAVLAQTELQSLRDTDASGSNGSKLFKRAITRMMTPGFTTDADPAHSPARNVLALCEVPLDGTGDSAAVAIQSMSVTVSAPALVDFFVDDGARSELMRRLSIVAPVEVIVPPAVSAATANAVRTLGLNVGPHAIPQGSVRATSVDMSDAVRQLSALTEDLRRHDGADAQRSGLHHGDAVQRALSPYLLQWAEVVGASAAVPKSAVSFSAWEGLTPVVLPAATLHHLGLAASAESQRTPYTQLLEELNFTRTAGGARCLRKLLLNIPASYSGVLKRQAAVRALTGDTAAATELSKRAADDCLCDAVSPHVAVDAGVIAELEDALLGPSRGAVDASRVYSGMKARAAKPKNVYRFLRWLHNASDALLTDRHTFPWQQTGSSSSVSSWQAELKSCLERGANAECTTTLALVSSAPSVLGPLLADVPVVRAVFGATSMLLEVANETAFCKDDWSALFDAEVVKDINDDSIIDALRTASGFVSARFDGEDGVDSSDAVHRLAAAAAAAARFSAAAASIEVALDKHLAAVRKTLNMPALEYKTIGLDSYLLDVPAAKEKNVPSVAQAPTVKTRHNAGSSKLKATLADASAAAVVSSTATVDLEALKSSVGKSSDVGGDWHVVNRVKSGGRYRTPFMNRALAVRDIFSSHAALLGRQAFNALCEVLVSGPLGLALQSFIDSTEMFDALRSFGTAASRPGWIMPQLCSTPCIHAHNARHPLAEAAVQASGGEFVPWEVDICSGAPDLHEGTTDTLVHRGPRCMVLTGPNMGGKSTFLRTVGTLAVLGMAGSPVPADSATIGFFDAVFMRMGAGDDLLSGMSTFLVEASEASAALKRATPRSLLLMDELGRGTSTWDGAGLATATLQHIENVIRAPTVFVTHYSAVAAEGLHRAGVCEVFHTASAVVESWDPSAAPADGADGATGKDIVLPKLALLYTLVPGPSPSAFALNVAAMAGMPLSVLRTAAKVSSALHSAERAAAPAYTAIQSFAAQISVRRDDLAAAAVLSFVLHGLWASFFRDSSFALYRESHLLVTNARALYNIFFVCTSHLHAS